MKKIIVNGCSFVAGDAVGWDDYLKKCGKSNIEWGEIIGTNRDEKTEKLYQDYISNYRKKINLPFLIKNKLNSELVDLSRDGNSNDGISFSTIQFLLNLPKLERKNYHVIIGWTVLSRTMKYCKSFNSFFNIHYGMVDFNNIGIKELKNYIISTIVNGYDEDFYLNYIKNVVMLESFLKLNNCTYTFYRSLGWNNDDNNFDIGNSLPIKLNQQTNKFYSDDRCWFKFLDDNTLGINGHSLSTMYLDNKKENWVSENNSHPNINVIQDFSSKLSTFIKHQNVGF